MPIIIGYMIGKAIGNLIVGVITLLIKLLYWACVAAVHIIKYAFITSRWLLGKLWEGGRDLYFYYKLNVR